jgi:hypothetical protein
VHSWLKKVAKKKWLNKKQMKRIIYAQMVKTGLLVVLFLYPFAARSFHISHEQICASASDDRRHDDNDCPVCQFHYTSYTGTELLELKTIPFYFSFEKPLYEEKEYDTSLFSYFLRGPPIC